MNLMPAISTPTTTPSGGRLVSVEGQELPLTGASIRARAGGGRARVELTQTFVNTEACVLNVVYKVPLPADGAVCGYCFTVGDTVVEGEVHRSKQAREQYEQAILEGRTAALLEQERTALFTQTLGNVPPGETVNVKLTIDQPLSWREEGAWEWRFPTVVAPRYLADTPADDVEGLQIDVAEGDIGARFALNLAVSDECTGDWASTSHQLVKEDTGISITGASLDRDVVIRWPVAKSMPGVSFSVARPVANTKTPADPALCAYGRFGLVPPHTAPHQSMPRDVVVLLDISGSMGGQPLSQAVRVVTELVRGLSPADHLELIAFSSRVERWRPGSVAMEPDVKRDACNWLGRLRANGGTDMHSGIREAVSGHPVFPGVQRQVLLVTDGYIGSEAAILGEILAERPEVTRVHALAVGSAPNRTLTGGVARAGGGVEAFIGGPEEDVVQAVDQLLKRTQSPLIVDLKISGDALLDVAPKRLPDLYAGSPATLYARVSPEGGTIHLNGRSPTGPWTHTLRIPATPEGAGEEAIATAWARERVEDLELGRIAGQPAAHVDASITQIGLTFSIATRLTSWLAVSKEVLVDGSTRRKEVVQPHAIPSGVNIEGFGLRGPVPQGMITGAPRSAPAMHSRSMLPKMRRVGGTGGFRRRGRPRPPAPTPMIAGPEAEEEEADSEGLATAEPSTPLPPEKVRQVGIIARIVRGIGRLLGALFGRGGRRE